MRCECHSSIRATLLRSRREAVVLSRPLATKLRRRFGILKGATTPLREQSHSLEFSSCFGPRSVPAKVLPSPVPALLEPARKPELLNGHSILDQQCNSQHQLP